MELTARFTNWIRREGTDTIDELDGGRLRENAGEIVDVIHHGNRLDTRTAGFDLLSALDIPSVASLVPFERVRRGDRRGTKR